MAIVSIQFAATRINGSGATVVPLNDPTRTNFSVYTRNDDGTVDWVVDYSRDSYNAALTKAAELSMHHGAFIEQIV